MANQYDTLSVYNASQYQQVLRYYLQDPTATLVAVTNSTTTRANRNSSTTGVNGVFQPIKDLDLVLSNTDSMPLAGYANNTDMAQTFTIEVPQDAFLMAIKLNLAFGLNVSVAGAGTVTFSQIQIDFKNADTGDMIYSTGRVNTGLTGIAAATGSQIFYMNDDIYPPNTNNRLYASKNMSVTITTVSSDTGAATRQVGMYPSFSIQKQLSPAAAIPYSYSFIDFYVYPTLDAPRIAINDRSVTNTSTIVRSVGNGNQCF